MITDTKIKIWRTETRPSTDVSFWNKTADDESYLETAYKEAGLFISEELTLSEDQLTRTRTQIWKRVPGIVSTLSGDAALTDQTARNVAYNESQGITRSVAQYDIISQSDEVLVSGVIHE